MNPHKAFLIGAAAFLLMNTAPETSAIADELQGQEHWFGPEARKAQREKEAEERRASQPAPTPAQHIVLNGPKRTIVVGKFTAVGAFTEKYGNWSIGDGLGAMLTTSLVNSNQFIVIERARLDAVLGEQELKASGMTTQKSGPKLGALSGAQLMIFGTVTEFSTDDKGGGMSLGLAKALGAGSLPFELGAANESSSGKVAMDIRIVDASTGEVLESHTVSEAIEDSAFGLSGGYSGISLGGDQFEKTPLGEASRGTINKAVAKIVEAAARRPWHGLVVAMSGGNVVINAGSRTGLKQGDMFMIESKGETFTDPSTGQVLGSSREPIGALQLHTVQEKLSFGSFNPMGSTQPKRGDLVKMMVR